MTDIYKREVDDNCVSSQELMKSGVRKAFDLLGGIAFLALMSWLLW